MSRSQSIVDTSYSYDGVHSPEQSFRQQLWEAKRDASEYRIKLEAERKRNSLLEENFLKLPVNIEQLEVQKAEIEVARSRIRQLENRLKDSDGLAAKFKKDLESFRDYAFKEIKDKEFTIIGQSTSIRDLESELSLIKKQSTLLYEQYEQLLKKPNTYKQKCRKMKEELAELRQKASLSKTDYDYMNVKLELSIAQKKILDLTKSREELAKKYSDLEMKNQHLSIVKSEIKTTLHRQNKTFTEMEFDFKNILEGIESQKSEEVNELIERIAVYERTLKELKHNHVLELAEKEEEVEKRKFDCDGLKRAIEKGEKEKNRLEREMNEWKKVADELQGEIEEKGVEFEKKFEKIVADHNEKVLKYKSLIHDLEVRNKELIDMAEIQSKSFLVENSLFDELSELGNDPRHLKNNHDSMLLKQFEENDSKFDKLFEKNSRMKEKKKILRLELEQKTETLADVEKKLRRTQAMLKEHEEKVLQANESINELNHQVENYELEKDRREKEIARLKDQCQEHVESERLYKEKCVNEENEMVKLKASIEENVAKLKNKYNDKIVKYKEDILDLTQTCSKLREALNKNTSAIESQKTEEVEKSKALLKKNHKLKEKVGSLMKCMKTQAEKISNLHSKLREFYSIPDLDENLEGSEQRQTQDKLEKLKKEHESLRQQYKELEAKMQSSSIISPANELLEKQLQELEVKNFQLEQSVIIATNRLKRAESDLVDQAKRYTALESTYQEVLQRLEDFETKRRRPDDFSDSDEEKVSMRQTRVIRVSVMEGYDDVTEGSVLEGEDFANPFEGFKESLVTTNFAVENKESIRIKELELELSQKVCEIRQAQETIKELERQLIAMRKENGDLDSQIKENEQRASESRMSIRQSSRDLSQEAILHEARMTLLQAHNQRLETELIVSKTNWGELTNSLIKDINASEKELLEARNDIRMLTEERELLVKRINEGANKKKWKFSDWLGRKKRNSDIL